MKTTTTIAALHALLGPPLGGVALFIVFAGLDMVHPPSEGPVPDPMMSIGGLMFLMFGSYAVGTIPAFFTGLLLGHKVSSSGSYGMWDAALAAIISATGCVLFFHITLAKGRVNWTMLHIDPIFVGIIGASVVAAVACRELLIWSEFIDRR